MGGGEKERGHSPGAVVERSGGDAFFLAPLRVPDGRVCSQGRQRALPEDLRGTFQRGPRRELRGAGRGRGEAPGHRSSAAESTGAGSGKRAAAQRRALPEVGGRRARLRHLFPGPQRHHHQLERGSATDQGLHRGRDYRAELFALLYAGGPEAEPAGEGFTDGARGRALRGRRLARQKRRDRDSGRAWW